MSNFSILQSNVQCTCIYLTWGNNLVQKGNIKHSTCVVGINCSLRVLFSAMLLFAKQNALFAETRTRTTNLKRHGAHDFPLNILGWNKSNEWIYDSISANIIIFRQPEKTTEVLFPETSRKPVGRNPVVGDVMIIWVGWRISNQQTGQPAPVTMSLGTLLCSVENLGKVREK